MKILGGRVYVDTPSVEHRLKASNSLHVSLLDLSATISLECDGYGTVIDSRTFNSFH